MYPVDRIGKCGILDPAFLKYKIERGAEGKLKLYNDESIASALAPVLLLSA